MKICWDNLEGMRITRNGNLVKGSDNYIEKESCKVCSEPYLTSMRKDRQSDFCDHSCRQIGKYNHMYDKLHSKETKRKMSESHSGRKHTMEHIISICGSGNPNWRGGVSYDDYCPIWFDKEYKKDIKERDSYTCQNPDCFGNSNNLTAHHIDYNKKNCQPKNLITLCISCNARANFERKWHKAWYIAIMERRYSNGYTHNQFSL